MELIRIVDIQRVLLLYSILRAGSLVYELLTQFIHQTQVMLKPKLEIH